MFDIKWIRENADAFDAALKNRNAEPAAQSLIEMDSARRAAQTRAQEIQADRNKLAKQIGAAKAKGEDAAEFEQLRVQLMRTFTAITAPEP